MACFTNKDTLGLHKQKWCFFSLWFSWMQCVPHATHTNINCVKSIGRLQCMNLKVSDFLYRSCWTRKVLQCVIKHSGYLHWNQAFTRKWQWYQRLLVLNMVSQWHRRTFHHVLKILAEILAFLGFFLFLICFIFIVWCRSFSKLTLSNHKIIDPYHEIWWMISMIFFCSVMLINVCNMGIVVGYCTWALHNI